MTIVQKIELMWLVVIPVGALAVVGAGFVWLAFTTYRDSEKRRRDAYLRGDNSVRER